MKQEKWVFSDCLVGGQRGNNRRQKLRPFKGLPVEGRDNWNHLDQLLFWVLPQSSALPREKYLRGSELVG